METFIELFKTVDWTIGINIISTVWNIFKVWWWLTPPIILFFIARKFYLKWRRKQWFSTVNFVLLRVKIPKEVHRPLRAMEQIFSSIWGIIYDSPDFREKWIKGKVPLPISLEIVGKGGEETCFFIRVQDVNQDAIESVIHSQYPQAEILPVEDYVKSVPLELPNKDWDLWGRDFILSKEDVYPIKTYSKFFEEKPEVDVEKKGKRLDPLGPLLEGMAKLGHGEQIWVQFIIKAVTNEDNNYIDRGKELVNKLIKRGSKGKPKTILREALEVMITGKPPGFSEEQKSEQPVITGGERDVIAAIEEKIGKLAFETNIRVIYLAKRDVYFAPRIKAVIGFFNQFSTRNLNSIKTLKKTSTSVDYFMANYRTYLRKKNMFKNYKERAMIDSKNAFVLDTEELTTMYHFSGREVIFAPFVPRVEIKKGEAPPELPTE